MGEPLVSTIIPAYNHEAFVEEAVRSVWRQTYRNHELIVLDDGSSDRTPEILKELARASPIPMKLILKSNEGPARALNQGIALAAGEFISWFASDDSLLENKVSHAVQWLSVPEHQRYGAIFGDCFIIGPAGEVHGRHSERCDLSPGKNFETVMTHKVWYFGGSATYRRTALDAVGPFDESMIFEDFDYWARFSYQFPIGYDNVPVSNYRVGMGGSLSSRIDRIAEEYIRVVEKLFAQGCFDRTMRRRYLAAAGWRIAARCYEYHDHARARRYALQSVLLSPSARALNILVRAMLPESGKRALQRSIR